MIRNYLKVAWRALKRQPGYTALNVGGLALGMACCILALLPLRYEWSFDRFHEKADHIYRVTRLHTQGGETSHSLHFGSALAPTLEREVPAVKQAVRLRRVRRKTVHYGNESDEDAQIYHADASFFDVFTFPLAKGTPRAALAQPNSVVLTPATAQTYFGDANPIGKTIEIEGDEGIVTYEVTGVLKKVPDNSHVQFDMLTPLVEQDEYWGGHMAYATYVLTQPNYSARQLEQDLADIARVHQADEVKEYDLTYRAQPLTKIHLYDLAPDGFAPSRRLRYLSIFAVIAAVILLVACVNYVNLAVARSMRRTREVGVRKVVGARRAQVAGRFLTESVLTCLGALVLALVLARLGQPVFEALTAQELSLSYVREGWFLAGLAGVLLVVGILSGSYPALFLSGLPPVAVLRGSARSAPGGTGLRKGLVVGQFAAAIALIISTGVIYQQVTHLRAADPGFDEEQVVVVKIPEVHIRKQFGPLKAEVLRHPSVVSASVSSSVPGPNRFTIRVPFSLKSSLRKVEETGGRMTFYRSKNEVRTRVYYVDADFPETYKLRWLRKRDALWETPTGSAMLISEALADELESDTTRVLGAEASAQSSGRIAGVVENLHFGSLRKEAMPVALVHDPSGLDGGAARRLSVRIRPKNVPETLDHLRATYDSFSPSEPFAYFFLDEHLDALYKSEARLARLFGVFALLTILIACLGLFGLAAYAAEARRQEIAIRKTFGASARQLVQLLSKEFLALVGIGFLAAVPVAWYAMQRWLTGFAYRITLSPWLFAAAGLVALLVAAGATSWQALRAARTNPAWALRNE